MKNLKDFVFEYLAENILVRRQSFFEKLISKGKIGSTSQILGIPRLKIEINKLCNL